MDCSVNKRTVVTKYNVKTNSGQWQRFIWVTWCQVSREKIELILIGPSFSHEKNLVRECMTNDTSSSCEFLVRETWTKNLGRVSWALVSSLAHNRKMTLQFMAKRWQQFTHFAQWHLQLWSWENGLSNQPALGSKLTTIMTTAVHFTST